MLIDLGMLCVEQNVEMRFVHLLVKGNSRDHKDAIKHGIIFR